LDEVIKNQPLLLRHWALYKRLAKTVRRQNEQGQLPPDDVKFSSFCEVLRNVEDSLLSDRIFLVSVQTVMRP
jgi:hypothetical protein